MHLCLVTELALVFLAAILKMCHVSGFTFLRYY
jgi:hypothetical protein